MSDRGASYALLALMLVLPVSALIARRLPLGSMLKMALAWLVIFVALFLLVGLWPKFA